MKKKFDCVDMKHKNAQKILEKTGGFSKEEELKFWQESTGKLINKRSALKTKIPKDSTGHREDKASSFSS